MIQLEPNTGPFSAVCFLALYCNKFSFVFKLIEVFSSLTGKDLRFLEMHSIHAKEPF